MRFELEVESWKSKVGSRKFRVGSRQLAIRSLVDEFFG